MLTHTIIKTAFVFTSTISMAFSASLQPVTEDFGPNPTGVKMAIYVPDVLPAHPAIILAVHYCSGTGEAYFYGTKYAQLAQQYGFIAIYPSTPVQGGCWDVASKATLMHNAGGDSLGLASMVRYTIGKYKADPSRVFVTGSSSGAMMTNVMLGAYPDLIAAGSAYSGVPFGCFAGPSTWNSQCSAGNLVKTGQAWGDEVRAAYPGYTGKRPRMQEWHGTSDFLLSYPNLAEENKQWSNVFGIPFTKNETNTPLPRYTKMIYGDGTQYVAYSALNVGHTVPPDELVDMAWFGLSPVGSHPAPTPAPVPTSYNASMGPTTMSTSVMPASTYAAPDPPAGNIAKYGQCGGKSWTGTDTCASGLKCSISTEWYSQCV